MLERKLTQVRENKETKCSWAGKQDCKGETEWKQRHTIYICINIKYCNPENKKPTVGMCLFSLRPENLTRSRCSQKIVLEGMDHTVNVNKVGLQILWEWAFWRCFMMVCEADKTNFCQSHDLCNNSVSVYNWIRWEIEIFYNWRNQCFRHTFFKWLTTFRKDLLHCLFHVDFKKISTVWYNSWQFLSLTLKR